MMCRFGDDPNLWVMMCGFGDEPLLSECNDLDCIGVPKGIRTPVTAVKGQCPRPLDDGDLKLSFASLNKVIVELGGIEPPTSCMPCKRSPS